MTMNKHLLLIILSFITWITPVKAEDLKLWYDRPADYWVEALPLGIRQENRDRLNNQIRKAADRLQLGDGRNGEAGRDAGGRTGKA